MDSVRKMIVEEEMDENEKPRFIVTSEKFKCTFTVQKKRDGYTFYEILASKGPLAGPLQGNWSTQDTALKAIKNYINEANVSPIVERDEKRKRAKQSAAAVQSNNEDSVQQGTAD